MTREFEYLLHLAGCGARGEVPRQPGQDIDWQLVEKLGEEQRVFAVMALAATRGGVCPEESRQALKGRMRQCALGGYVRQERMLELLAEMWATGSDAMILKGVAVAQSYAVPEARLCADTDLYVNPREEKRALELLRDRGFVVEPRDAESCHSVCSHEEAGTVELHVDLFSKADLTTWFGGPPVKEYISFRAKEFRVGERLCRTLEDTDHMIFLVLHLANHLAATGASLSMILDVGAFLTRNASTIDAARLGKALSRAGCGGVFQAVLCVCDTYCGFDTASVYPHETDADAFLPLMLLNDLEVGGGMGKNSSLGRQIGGNMNVRAKITASRGRARYWAHRWGECVHRFRKMVLPTQEEIAAKYPAAGGESLRTRLRRRTRYTQEAVGGYFLRRKRRADACRQGLVRDRAALLKALGML